jgi:CheY-like chemotaxis protein
VLPYDLIFMDGHRPEMDSYAAAGIRRQSTRHLPIVAMSAEAMDGCRENCLAAGTDDISRPVRPDDLMEASLGAWRRSTADAAAGR